MQQQLAKDSYCRTRQVVRHSLGVGGAGWVRYVLGVGEAGRVKYVRAWCG